MNSRIKKTLISFILILLIVAIILYLDPCKGREPVTSLPGNTNTAAKPAPNANHPHKSDKPHPHPEVGHDEPTKVDKDGNGEPDLNKCVFNAFPPEAKPYVKLAKITVRLEVDERGVVQSVAPIGKVAFEPLPDVELEGVLYDEMKALFTNAAKNSFRATKKCPQRMVSRQPVDYVIEVPLRYALK